MWFSQINITRGSMARGSMALRHATATFSNYLFLSIQAKKIDITLITNDLYINLIDKKKRTYCKIV